MERDYGGLIGVGVVAHRQRENALSKLAQSIGVQASHVDDGSLGCEDNHLVVLRRLYDGYPQDDWLVVLEDDAQPVNDFRAHLGAALEHAPAPVVGLYLGTGNPSGEAQRQIKQAVDKAKATNAAWLLADCLIGSVGYAVNRGVLADVLEFIAGRDEELPLRISRWAQITGHPIAYTQPSLVNHADQEPIGRPWQGPHRLARRAWSYGTRSRWDTGAVVLGYCPVWSAPPPP